MSVQLNQTNLNQLSSEIKIPKYDRRKLGQGIVHIGVGGFHRAHQTIYTEDLFDQNEDLEWGFCGIGLLSHDRQMRDILQEQDYLYTLIERSVTGDHARIVGSIVNYIFAPENIERAIEKMAGPETKIVSLTITEGGYYIHSGTGEFDPSHADIQYDLAHPQAPRSSFGFLLEALDRRRCRQQKPFTVMSCDNIQSNGLVTKKMLLAFAKLSNPELANWIEEHVSFPNSMVDRITPATTDEHRELTRKQFGIADKWPVTTEPFKQWVIEDHFTLGRPSWEKTGAQMTNDVLPYEKMKLRLLNASHQALCYIGMLLGYEFVHQTMEDEDIRNLVSLLMDIDVTPILSEVPGVDLTTYKRTLIERFANPAIRDQLSRIGIYGSTGIPKFMLPTIEEQLKKGGSFKYLAFTIACWFRYLQGKDELGNDIVMKDPNADTLKAIALASAQKVGGFLELREIFSGELSNSEEFVTLVQKFLTDFYTKGARNTLREVTSIP